MNLKDKIQYMTTVEVYELVLNGTISRFPEKFWVGEEGVERGLECVEYLLYKKLNWNNEKIKNKFSKALLIKYKLGGMLSICFGNSPLKCIMSLLGDTFLPWEYNVAPRNYWNINTAREATQYMLNKLEWKDEDIKKNLSQRTFNDFGLLPMLMQVYNSSPYNAINDLMPNKFKEWELRNTPLNFWNENNCKKAIIWVLTEKVSDTYEYMNYNQLRDVFFEHGLNYMLTARFDNSIKKALDFVKSDISVKKMIYKHKPLSKITTVNS